MSHTHIRHTADVHLQVRADNLPPGICGRVTGIALTFDVVDSYRTMFARGCADRTIQRKVTTRKLPLLMDHERSTGAHVGVVSSMTDTGPALMMAADLFDTADGRAALEYAKAVIASGASTGFSIGFRPMRSEMLTVDNEPVERFTEIELREVSMTPMPAVPGTDVLGARTESDVADPMRSDVQLLEVAAKAALNALPADVRTALLVQYTHDMAPQNAPAVNASVSRAVPVDAPVDSPASVPAVTMGARIAAVRASYS